MRTVRTLAIAAAVAFAIIGVWLTVSPGMTLRELQRAVAAGDQRTIDSHVDYPRLRTNFRTHFVAEADRIIARNGPDRMSAIIAKAMAGGIVDTFITPSGVARMMANDKVDGRLSWLHVTGKDLRIERLGLTRFAVRLRGGRGGPVLQLEDLKWRIVDIEIPETNTK